MKLNRLTAIACVLSVACICGCGKNEIIDLNEEKVPVNYNAVYHVTAESQTSEKNIEYDNAYSVTLEGEELVITSKVDEHWDNNKEGEDYLEGRQIVTTLSRLQTKDAAYGVPNYVEEEFYVTAEETYYTKFTFEHDHSINAGILKIKEYSKNSESGFSEELYTVGLEEQYFDKDSLPFIISSFPEKSGVISISSGNRNSLQTVKYEYMEKENITVEAGEFTCNVIRLRPNTNFSVNSARIYFDTETGIPVKVVHDTSVMELKSFNFN